MEKLIIVAISVLYLFVIHGPHDVFVYMNNIGIFFSNFGRKCIMSEDGTTNYHIGPHRRHIIRILPTYKTRNRICVTDVRNNGIKCVTEKCVPRNCVMAGN